MNKTPIQIRFADIDMMGHVNNVNISHYLDLGRMNCLGTIVGKFGEIKAETLVIVHTENNYLAPIFIDDKITVYTAVHSIGDKSVTMFQRVVDEHENVKMESRSIMSTFNRTTNQSFPMPDEWRKRLEEMKE